MKQKTKFNLFIVLLIITMISILIYYFFVKEKFNTPQDPKDIEVPNLPRPFVNLLDDKGNKVNVILVSHPFTRETGDNGSYEQYNEWKDKGIHFVGITSYSEFPSVYSNPHDALSDPEDHSWKNHDYMKYFRLWLTCFRDSDKYIKDTTTKKALISESDFINTEKFVPNPNMSKKYDFIYICLEDDKETCKEGWNYYIRNWEFAKKALKVMCLKHHLKGAIIGRKNCTLPKGCSQYIELFDKLPQDELVKLYQQSKFLFLPNTADASPRVLPEALCCNLGCLVNYNILGGWKYVNIEKTGEFFKDENDFEPALLRLLQNLPNYAPREYYTTNWGKHTTGVELKKFLLNNLSNLNFTDESTKWITL